MNATDLAFTPALTQAYLIRTGQVSPTELVELYLERIQRLDPSLHSYFTVMAEQALAEAQQKTEQLAHTSDPATLPPFFGVPISIKDLNPVAGVRCTYGSKALINYVAAYDDGVVTRIKQAGLTILGKTATSELGSFPYTEPDWAPPTRNPWNLDYTSGGSSGGAASSLAAGLCAIAQASDGGGSIRGPAFCCGLVGLKPSRGRVTHAPVGDALSGLATDGGLTRTVLDAAAFLDILAGYVPGDPYWLENPPTSFLSSAEQGQQGQFPRPLRIAYATSILPLGEVDPVCQQAVLETVQRLEALGHAVEATTLDCTGLIEPVMAIWQAGIAVAGIPPEGLQPMNAWLLSRVGRAGEHLRAVGAMQMVARKIVRAWETVDVMVLPVAGIPAMRVGEWADLPFEETLQHIIRWVAPCAPFNATGQPAIALPTGFDPNGVPVGVQLVGKPAQDATILALAAQLEAAYPWDHHPALATAI